MAVLVDSSLWVHQLRRTGDPGKRARVETLLQAGSACWCPPVRLELWRGVATDDDRKALRRYEALLPSYDITHDVWERAIRLADRGRAAGVRRGDQNPQVLVGRLLGDFVRSEDLHCVSIPCSCYE